MEDYTIFISHSHKEKELATKIQSEMESYGLTSFVAHEDIEPNEEWAKTIIATGRHCEIFVYILTENFRDSASRWTDHEIGMGIGTGAVCITISPDGTVPYGALAHLQKASLVSCNRPKDSFCVKVKKSKIPLADFIISEWAKSDPLSLFEKATTSLERAISFVEANNICEGIAKVDQANPLTKGQVQRLVKIGIHNNQVLNKISNTRCRVIISELIGKRESKVGMRMYREFFGLQ